MAQLNEDTIREMKRSLVHAKKRLERYDEKIAEIRRLRKEQEKRLLNREYS